MLHTTAACEQVRCELAVSGPIEGMASFELILSLLCYYWHEHIAPISSNAMLTREAFLG